MPDKAIEATLDQSIKDVAAERVEAERLESFEVRAERMLDKAYRGIYHVGGRIKKDKHYWEFSEHQDLSTYDAELLTRLVIGAHDECLRLSVLGEGGPRRVKIRIHPRTGRDGSFYERHPTMEQAILNYRTPGTRHSVYAKPVEAEQ